MTDPRDERIKELERELATCQELSDLRLEGEARERRRVWELERMLTKIQEVLGERKET